MKARWIAIGVLSASAVLVLLLLRSPDRSGSAHANEVARRADSESLVETRATEPTPSVVETPAEGDARAALTTDESRVKNGADEASTGGEDRLSEDLEAATRTYLTDQPDTRRMHELLRRCAKRMQVDAASVRTDEHGVVTGQVRDPVSGRVAAFEVDGDRYRVTFDEFTDGELASSSLSMRQISIQARDDPSGLTGASIGVQFHPDARAGSKLLADGASEKFIGWNVSLTADGMTASPLTVKAGPDGKGLEVGHTRNIAPRDEPGAFETSAFDAWLQRLRDVKPSPK